LELSTNDREKVFEEMSRILNVSHQVLPATIEDAELCARLEDGTVVRGETNIDIPRHDGRKRIEDVFLDPPAKAYPKALEAIKKSDMVVIGPGDLYSSLAQVLLTEGMREAIEESSAKTVYICNLMTKHGETNNYRVSDFAKTVEGFLKKEVDHVIYNDRSPSGEELESFKERNPELLGMVEEGDLKEEKFVGADLLKEGFPVHDPRKLSEIILSL